MLLRRNTPSLTPHRADTRYDDYSHSDKKPSYRSRLDSVFENGCVPNLKLCYTPPEFCISLESQTAEFLVGLFLMRGRQS